MLPIKNSPTQDVDYKTTQLNTTFKVINDNNFDDELIEKIISHLANDLSNSKLSPVYKFHLVDHEQHLYLTIQSIQGVLTNNRLIIEIGNIKVHSYEDILKCVAGRIKNLSFEKFKDDLKQYPLIEVNPPEPVRLPSNENQRKDTEEEIKVHDHVEDFSDAEIKIPKTIDYPNATFFLSEEVIKNLKGLRGEDHKFDINHLHVCLNKRVKKLIKTEKDKYVRKVFDFNVEGKQLRLIVDHHPQNSSDKKLRFTIVTGFFARK